MAVNNASKRPPGRYDFAGVKGRRGACIYCAAGERSEKIFQAFLAPRGDTKHTDTHLSHAHSNSFGSCLGLAHTDIPWWRGLGLPMIGTVDGSRAKYDVGI